MSAELATPAAKAAKDEANSSKIVPVDLPYGDKARWLFRTTFVQVSIACVILFNFGAIVVEKEIDPCSDASMQKMPELWAAIDDVCNVIFLLELILNLYGHWWRPFLQSGWNYLDTVVVIIGVIGLMRIDLGDFKRIKIIRAFRILRLFKRVESLNQILSALIRSIPGVLNAFIVMLIFMMIFAIVAVDFFKDHGSSGTYTTVQTYGEADAQWGQGEGMEWTSELPSVENTTVIKAMTLRGFHFGQEYFGTFFRSLFTLFQVLTGESWSEAVVRPLLFGYDPGNAFLVATFFTIYILLTNVVLQNVVVAVLLDKFNEDPNDSSAAAAEGAEGGGGALATYEIPSHAAIAGQVSKRGGKQPAESSRLTKADTAVLREASRLGARVDIPPSGGGGMRSGASEGGDEVARLRGDVDRALREAAMIRSHLHVILSRLPEPPEDAAESSMAA